MNITKLQAKRISFGGTRNMSAIRFIVLHYTGNHTDSAMGNARYFSPTGDNQRSAGAHYFVDESCIVQSIPDNRIAWSVGGTKYPNCASTGGGKKYGIVTNTNSVSIEMCSTNGVIPEKTVRNAVILTRLLMKKYRIPRDHVVRHFDVTGKSCPGWSGWIGKNDSKWKAFQKALAKSEIWYAVTTDEVNVREKPSKSATFVTTMRKGATIAVVEETTHWVRRKHGGWIAKKYIKKK